MKIIDTYNLEYELMNSEKTGEVFSEFALLSDHLELVKFFLTKEILKPGARSSSKHYHTENEEVFFILKGTPTLIVNTEKRILKPGNIVAFKQNSIEYHTLINESDVPVEFLCISSTEETDKVIYEDGNNYN